MPELCRDLFIDTVRQNQLLTLTVNTTLMSMNAAIDVHQASTAQTEIEMLRMIEEVNNAKCCRHCGLENNVYFEHEGLPLQCKCRTRY
jgi:hypothetical protein